MAIPLLTPLPSPPLASDPEEIFDVKAGATLAAQKVLVDEMNASTIPGVNALSLQVDASTTEAAGYATSAQAAAEEAALVASQTQAAADAAAASELNAQAAAAAAGAAIGLPALAGNARKPLRVLLDETGVEFADVLALTAVMEKTAVIPSASGPTALNLSAASLFDITLSANTTLTISSPPVFLDETLAIVIRITQGATARTLTWFPNISWLTVAGAAPSAPGANRIVEYILTTTDGVNWIGRRGSAN